MSKKVELKSNYQELLEQLLTVLYSFQAKLTSSSPVVNGKVKIKRQLSGERDNEPMETKKPRTEIEPNSEE